MNRKIVFLFFLCFLMLPVAGFAQGITPQKQKIGFVIHGGAGVISRGSLTPEKEAEYRKKLEEAVLTGYAMLEKGSSGLDAVEAAIRMLEDSPLFNAGKGAVFTADGKNELDASIMEGRTMKAGAVAGLHRIKNPISLARKVMENSPHVMMVGEGAEKFAKEQNFEFVEEKYFWTKERWDSLQRIIKEEKEKEKQKGKTQSFNVNQDNPFTTETQKIAANKFGTVGAVALDKQGDLVAGTSTGGMTYKKYGRVGDAPIIGAGTFASNASCAVSATGWGEYFIRLGVARDIAALVEYKGMKIQEAADMVIKQKLQAAGGDGGVIALDKQGNIGISFNSEGMYRAYVDENGKAVVEIYK